MRGLRRRSVHIMIASIVIIFVLASPVRADEGGGVEHGFALTFFWIAVILLAAKISSLIEHIGQPSVLGELLIGIVLGNLVLVGIPFFEGPKNNPTLIFLAELGVVILLFQVGLESNLAEMGRVGPNAALVAIIGVMTPFILGTYVIGPLLLPGLDFYAYLFLGAALTATSVGITARVFQDLGKLQSPEAKTVLGAAVIDDILGLILLAVISAVVRVGSVSIGEVIWIVVKTVIFLTTTIISGLLLAPYVNQLFSKINAGIGMKFALLVSSALIFAYLAEVIGLAPIVGAFAAGLVLDSVHYRNFKDSEIIDDLRASIADSPPEVKEKIVRVIEAHADRHAEELVEPVAQFFVPIFFVMTGMAVRLGILFSSPSVFLVALGITAVAIVGKLVAGLAAAGGVSKSIVGWSMVPRGEVGLIFATIGKAIGVVSDDVFSVIVIVVIFTTLITPPALSLLMKHYPVSIPEEKETAPESEGYDAEEGGSRIRWQTFEAHFGSKSTRQLKKLRIRGIHWKIPTKR